jgi:hypothetical protein
MSVLIEPIELGPNLKPAELKRAIVKLVNDGLRQKSDICIPATWVAYLIQEIEQLKAKA